MTGSLIRKSLLRPVDLRVLPTPAVLGEMLKPGIPLAFCIASAMAMVVTATNMAAGMHRWLPLSSPFTLCCTLPFHWCSPPFSHGSITIQPYSSSFASCIGARTWPFAG